MIPWIITRSISHMRRLDRCQRSIHVKPVHQYPAPDRRVVVGAQAGASTVAITSRLVVVGDVAGEPDVRVLESGGAERVLLGGAGVDQVLRPGDAVPGVGLVQGGDQGVPDADRRVQPAWGLGGVAARHEHHLQAQPAPVLGLERARRALGDDPAVEHDGRIVAEGTPSSLKAEDRGRLRLQVMLVPGSDTPESPGWLHSAVRVGNSLVTALDEADAGHGITWAQDLVDAGTAEEYALGASTLEDAYIRLTGHVSDDDEA